ncbi:MAG: hypothetical protein BWY99_01612 [Synergistetes bacterium ADurb.BinA166]|nr:MAG: hypothetical protein BWY99_01612 [Synergistetes bacterium ADurb.BinA166]
MSYKDLGPNVSQKPQAVAPGAGQFSAEDRSFESVVLQQNKPPADWEMNLIQELLGSSGVSGLAQRLLPSCWLTNGFLERSGISASYVPVAPDPGVGANANRFQLRGSDLSVNGWQLRFDLTQSATPGINLLQVPIPPVGGKRTDLVILEVWRALVSPAPSSVNKSPAGQILRYGNAKAPDGPPIGNQNLADDLIDPTFLAETARRVQIQYRYRVITGVDVGTYPDGLDSPTVVANTAPYFSSLSVDGAATAFTFVKHPSDPGLWVAGTNDAAGVTALGTVDGLMYAIPICAVFRRNSAAFTRGANPNGGGLMASGVSGRPDGLYSDQVVLGDILDLRKGIAWDLHEVLEKSFQEVLDGTLTTAQEALVSVGGPVLSVHDDLGVSGHIGNPDSVRRNFSDRSVTESVVACVILGAPSATVVINLNALLPSYSVTPVNVLAAAPTGTNIAGLGKIRMAITGVSETDLTDASNPVFLASALLDVNVGPGVDRVTLTLNTPAAAGNIFYVELLVEYPWGHGVSRNALGADAFWTPPAASLPAWVDPAPLTATSDATRFSLSQSYWWFDVGHRELSAALLAQATTVVIRNSEAQVIYIPDYVTGSVTIDDGTNPPYATTNYAHGSGYAKVLMNFSLALQTAISVTWTALRPLPPVAAAPGDSYQIFYTSSGVQSLPVPAGTQTLNLVPRAVSKSMHVFVSGTGSPDSAFPFSNPGEMVPVGLLPGPSYPEARLNTPNPVSIVGFSVNTGYVSLPTFVPYTPDPGQVTLYKSAPDSTVDGDGRNFWPKSDSGAFAVYSPTILAQQLSFGQRHKTAVPVLMELKQDVPSVGRRGTMVLVVFSSWTDFSSSNFVEMLTTVSPSCAAVYRIRGSLMNPRRPSV